MSDEIEVRDVSELETIEEQKPTRAVRKGASAKSVQFHMLNPFEADDEAKKLVKKIVGKMPKISSNLTPQQRVFIQSYYNTLFDIPASLVDADISLEQYNNWMTLSPAFVNAIQSVEMFITSKIQSISLQNALYEKDPKLLIKILESLMSKRYSDNDRIVEEDDDVEILSDALKMIEQDEK